MSKSVVKKNAVHQQQRNYKSKNIGEESDEDTCIVCCQSITIFSIGVCDHPVCYECSTRMRILCDQRECPICRRKMPKVIFSDKIDLFATLNVRQINTTLFDAKYGIVFGTQAIKQAYSELLEFRCTECKTEHKVVFDTFNQLRDHIRREHDLTFCEICVNNLKIFSSERRCYTIKELGYHRRQGDRDDTSHRGHPLCQFCDTRFVDNDDLYRHLRQIHHYCYFCDADGKHQYYATLDTLLEHFRDEHYVCEEGDCVDMPLSAVFRTQIDFKAHMATQHARGLSRSANKQARTLELQFSLAPRSRHDHNTRFRGESSRNFNEQNDNDDFQFYTQTNNAEHRSLNPENFPALGSTVNAGNSNNSGGGGGGGTGAPSASSTTKTTLNLAKPLHNCFEGQMNRNFTGQDFPSLGGRGSSSNTQPQSSSVRLSVKSVGKSKNVDIQIQSNRFNTATTTTTTTTTTYQERFPALSSDASVPQKQPQWVSKRVVAHQAPASSQQNGAAAGGGSGGGGGGGKSKVAPAPQLPPPSNFSEFPVLISKKKNKHPKKFTSLTAAATPATSYRNIALSTTDAISRNGVNNTPSNNNNINKNGVEIRLKNVIENGGASSSTSNTNNINSNNNGGGSSGSSNGVGGSGARAEGKSKNGKISALINSNNNEKVVTNVYKNRSELKIGSLSSSKSPKKEEVKEEEHKKPSGFATDVPSNNLTFTASTGQSYAIKPLYIQPENFAVRNNQLISTFARLMPAAVLQEFRSYSSLFRAGRMSAPCYYEHCVNALSRNFDEVFPELLVLLPDVKKQQELFSCYAGGGTKRRDLIACKLCNQVLYDDGNIGEHVKYHQINDNNNNNNVQTC